METFTTGTSIPVQHGCLLTACRLFGNLHPEHHSTERARGREARRKAGYYYYDAGAAQSDAARISSLRWRRAFVPAPRRAPLAPLLGRKRGRGNSKDADDAPKAPKKKKSSGAAAKAAALAEEALAPKPKQTAPDRVTAKQKIQKRRGNEDKVVVVEEEETKGRERKKAQDEISPERRELLRGVAAAESAYAAAELLADAVQAENYERDASESAAIEGYFDTSRWPSAVLGGLGFDVAPGRVEARGTTHARRGQRRDGIVRSGRRGLDGAR